MVMIRGRTWTVCPLGRRRSHRYGRSSPTPGTRCTSTKVNIRGRVDFILVGEFGIIGNLGYKFSVGFLEREQKLFFIKILV